jgi:hypothetical protein
MSEIPEDLIEVSPEFAAIVGLSVAECKKLSMKELSNRAFDAGYDLQVTTSKALAGIGHLKMTVERFVKEHTAPLPRRQA